MSVQDLSPLVEELKLGLGDVAVHVASAEEHGVGVTLYEVIHIYVTVKVNLAPHIWKTGLDIVIKAVGAYFLKRFAKHRSDGNHHQLARPKVATIYDQYGNPLRIVEMLGPDTEPTITDDPNVPRRLPLDESFRKDRP